MPVPSSGTLRLRADIALEVDGSATGTNVSLGTLSDTAGFSAPDAMSDFYGYSAIETGLSSVLYSENLTSSASWQSESVDLTDYSGCVVRAVWHYVSGSSYTGDYQLDNIIVTNTGLGTYTFESSNHSFETSFGQSTYGGVSWGSVSTGTTPEKWNRESGDTPSEDTGLDPDSNSGGGGSYHVYAETSGDGYPNSNFWLRSPEIWLPNNSSSKLLQFDYAAYGATVGQIKVYVDVISIHNTGYYWQY